MSEWVAIPMFSADGDKLLGFDPVQELVRCKDCKHDRKCHKEVVLRTSNGEVHCPVDFCSRGERKVEE